MITLLFLVGATYMYGAVLYAHPIRGESHNQRNTTGEVATGICFSLYQPYDLLQVMPTISRYTHTHNSRGWEPAARVII